MVNLGSVAVVRMSLHKRGWYIDRFGMERECLVVTMAGLGAPDQILMVLGLDGKPLHDVSKDDVYYVPTSADPDQP